MGWRSTLLFIAYDSDPNLREQVNGNFPVNDSKRKRRSWSNRLFPRVKHPNKYLTLCPFQCHGNPKTEITDHPFMWGTGTEHWSRPLPRGQYPMPWLTRGLQHGGHHVFWVKLLENISQNRAIVFIGVGVQKSVLLPLEWCEGKRNLLSKTFLSSLYCIDSFLSYFLIRTLSEFNPLNSSGALNSVGCRCVLIVWFCLLSDILLTWWISRMLLQLY